MSAGHKRKKYVADLRRLGALGESNYRRILQLTGDSETGLAREFSLQSGETCMGVVSISLIERCKYTDTLYLEQVHNSGKWLNNPRFTVRSYHDARVAEVISCFRHQRIEAVNAFPNKFMHHPDEKVQINAFLSDWLAFCLRFGHSSCSITPPL
ncbi:MAG: hypothetical protein CSB48_03305 [Proteobacteria bacterium]|nr:MAG: hypothetical protein CSB48_03305 [Pseudomonadota bacterium]